MVSAADFCWLNEWMGRRLTPIGTQCCWHRSYKNVLKRREDIDPEKGNLSWHLVMYGWYAPNVYGDGIDYCYSRWKEIYWRIFLYLVPLSLSLSLSPDGEIVGHWISVQLIVNTWIAFISLYFPIHLQLFFQFPSLCVNIGKSGQPLGHPSHPHTNPHTHTEPGHIKCTHIC